MKDSYGYCTDCGTKYSDGCCPNCHEELHIFTTQYEYLPDELSEDFKSKLEEQVKQTK